MSLERAEAIRQNIRAFLRKRGAGDISQSHHLTWQGLSVVYYPTSDTFNWFGPESPRDITRSMRKQQVLEYIEAHMNH